MSRLPLVVALVAVLGLSGCLGMLNGAKTTPPTGATPTTPSVVETASTTSNSNASASTSANSTSNQTYDYSSCMVGMDMPGCPAWVAEKRYQDQVAKSPPDRTLPAVKIVLDPQGKGQAGGTTFDDGTMQVLLAVYLNDTGQGPYAAVGPGGQGDLTLELKGASGTKVVTLGGTADSAGVDPAVPLKKGPYTSILSMPSPGAWTLTLKGQGTNVEMTLTLVERFTM